MSGAALVILSEGGVYDDVLYTRFLKCIFAALLDDRVLVSWRRAALMG